MSVENLNKKLEEMGVNNIHVSWGEKAGSMTADERAEVLLKALDSLGKGEAELVTNID